MNLAPLFQARTAFIVTLLVSVGALGAALIGQLAFGLKPCEMCLYQRIPYAALIILSIIALAMKKPKADAAFLGLFLIGFLVSAALAFFHFGIEQHWWTLDRGCSVPGLKATTPEAMLAEILSTPQADCAEVGWRILGLSITVWNTALSVVMAAYTLFVMLRKRA